MSIISRGAVVFNNRPSWIDEGTMETIDSMKCAFWRDEFFGHTLNTHFWRIRDNAGATEGIINHANGQGLELALTAVNQIQLAAVDQEGRDSTRFGNKSGVEFRVMFTVLPTAGTTAFLGYIDLHNADPDVIPQSIWFRWDDNGTVTVEHDDNAGSETSKVATGVTVLVDEWHIFRIDATVVSDIKFYIDGNRVASGTTFTFASDPNADLQHYLRIGKVAPAVSVGTLVADCVQIFQGRG